jgi:hypothetical protein
MTLVKTYFNREEHPCNHEVNDLPSETIPDQTMSIRTILDRYSRGLPIDGQLNGTYQEDDDYNDMPDPRTLDLAERQEMAESAKQELEQIKTLLKSKNAKNTATAKVDVGTESTVDVDDPTRNEAGDNTHSANA